MKPTRARHTVLPTCRVALAGHEDPDIDREWLLTNGLGGFAMGTVSGCNTRRYHGLLIAARRPPVDRFNTVNLVGEQLVLDDQAHSLFTLQFRQNNGPPLFHPTGWRYLDHFEKDLTCRWVYRVGPLRLTKQLRLIWKRQIALLTYRLDRRPDARQPLPDQINLRLLPLLSLRDFHGEREDASAHLFQYSVDQQTVTVTAWNLPTVQMAVDVGRFHDGPDCWRDVYYRLEAERGLNAVEQLYTPGCFESSIDPDILTEGNGSLMRLMIAAEPIDWSAADQPDGRMALLADHINHVNRPLRHADSSDTLTCLTVAANDFVVDRLVNGQTMSTLIAGYPWFSDWGRDTFISLPGLLLCTGRFDDARRTLCAYAGHLRDGLIPNRFDDYGGPPIYNTVDASLWFVHAALQYLHATADQATWSQTLQPACAAILRAYRDGTAPLIGMDDDGLIAAGNPDTQLTWMDARCDGVSFTPRHGKAVEINALWYHDLVAFTETASGTFKDLAALIPTVRKAFNATFWLNDGGYLADHVNDAGPDRSIRPNQLFAVSLEHSPLSLRRRQSILRRVTDKLLTPRGLRTLPTDDPNYHGRCVGSMYERDRAYHQGTVWPWLIGPYVEGLLRTKKFSAAAIRQARRAVAGLLEAFITDSLGQLHEIYDGDPPHAPRGCIAQAWSIAELLRAVWLIESHSREPHSPHR